MGRSWDWKIVVLCAIVWATSANLARAQAPTLAGAGASPSEPGSTQSSLGPTPGAGANPFGASPGTDAILQGGRAGPSFPRVSTSITTPGGTATLSRPAAFASTPRPRITNVPLFGTLEVPDAVEAEGPPGGLTLEAAIGLLIRENLPLRSMAMQIPRARADVLTAGLRANPILFADSQLVPYGHYSRRKPGGPTQYDLNVTHPFDVSGKRQARVEVAERVTTILEAQYQNSVRLEVDGLHTVFVDVLAARETLRYAEASLAGLRTVLATTEELYRKADSTRPDVDRIRILRDAAGLGVLQARETLLRSKRNLGVLLNFTPDAADALEVRGTIADLAPRPPALDELIRIALESRPDLQAQRFGIGRADADVRLALASRFSDVYVLYQPYTFQNNPPFGTRSATSWAIGATVPVPISNRNQGGILRARLNVDQSRTELAARERRVVVEVRQAEREYAVTRSNLSRTERDALPAARQLRDDTFKLYRQGELNALAYYHAQKEYNEAVRHYRDLAIRHRRSMLAINTAVGCRVMP